MKAYACSQTNADQAGCCRPRSADGDASSSAGLEAAGLYWRKHRLLLPQGYTMTATLTQAAANPASAAPQDPGSADADMDELTSSSAAAQQHIGQTSTFRGKPNAAELQSEFESVEAAHAVDVAGGSQWLDNEHDNVTSAEILTIEDAAELTCHRAAVILRQLSCECQAAGSCARRSEANCSSSAADQEQQHVILHQGEADRQSAVRRTDGKSSAAALLSDAMPQMLLSKAAVGGESEEQQMLLEKAEIVAEQPEEQLIVLQQGQASISGSAVHAAGVQWGSGRALRLPGGYSSTSREMSSASLTANTWEEKPGRHVSRDTACPSMEQGLDCPAASAAQVPAQQGGSSSSFLQRLQMSKHAASGSSAASHQAKNSRQGEHPFQCCSLGLLIIIKVPNSGLELLCLHCMCVLVIYQYSNNAACEAGCRTFSKVCLKYFALV